MDIHRSIKRTKVHLNIGFRDTPCGLGCPIDNSTIKPLSDQCPNLMNLSRVSNPPKTGFN